MLMVLKRTVTQQMLGPQPGPLPVHEAKTFKELLWSYNAKVIERNSQGVYARASGRKSFRRNYVSISTTDLFTRSLEIKEKKYGDLE